MTGCLIILGAAVELRLNLSLLSTHPIHLAGGAPPPSLPAPFVSRGRFDVRTVANDGRPLAQRGRTKLSPLCTPPNNEGDDDCAAEEEGPSQPPVRPYKNIMGMGYFQRCAKVVGTEAQKNPPSPMNAGPLRCHEYVEHLDQMS